MARSRQQHLDHGGAYTWFAIEVVEMEDAANPPYDFSWRKEGQPAAKADADFDSRRNGSSIGTIRFGAGATAATFIASAAVTLEIGNELTVVAPASVDVSLADLVVTLLGGVVANTGLGTKQFVSASTHGRHCRAFAA